MERENRRKHLRIETSLDVCFSIDCTEHAPEKVTSTGKMILGFARTKDISIGGMHLQLNGSPYETRSSLTPANASVVLGKTIEVQCAHPDLTIWGEVVRVERPSLDVGIVISKVSDVSLWKKVCSEHSQVISIFPDSPRIRRMRRS
ncbi:MAG: hypothetical protein RRA35_03375 [Desulfomonilia bacterium]|nr:hypothetical protein [Desulfomonilia bacterium]